MGIFGDDDEDDNQDDDHDDGGHVSGNDEGAGSGDPPIFDIISDGYLSGGPYLDGGGGIENDIEDGLDTSGEDSAEWEESSFEGVEESSWDGDSAEGSEAPEDGGDSENADDFEGFGGGEGGGHDSPDPNAPNGDKEGDLNQGEHEEWIYDYLNGGRPHGDPEAFDGPSDSELPEKGGDEDGFF